MLTKKSVCAKFAHTEKGVGGAKNAMTKREHFCDGKNNVHILCTLKRTRKK